MKNYIEELEKSNKEKRRKNNMLSKKKIEIQVRNTNIKN